MGHRVRVETPFCPRCGWEFPLGEQCPGCAEPVTVIVNDGRLNCNHRVLPVTFDPIEDGRYRVVMPMDGSTIHECMTADERAEAEREIAEMDRRSRETLKDDGA
jgi:hypothetical protein